MSRSLTEHVLELRYLSFDRTVISCCLLISNPMEIWTFIILGIIGFLGVALLIHFVTQHYEKVRREALENFAQELSLDFHPLGHPPLLEKIQDFKLFNSGHSRKMTNLILGETDVLNVAIFDYRYTTGSGKNQQTHYQTVVAMEAPDLQIPSFTLRPESLFDWFGSVLGLQDIDFDDHPEFSNAFVLKSENETAVRNFFDRELLDFFAERKGITFEGGPGKFIYFKGGKTTKPEEMRSYLEEGYSVYSAFVARMNRGGTDV